MADYRLTQTGNEVQQILNNAAMQSQVTAETERAQEAEQALGRSVEQNAQDISGINGKIPAAASSSNKLADTDYVNQSIERATPEYQGTYNQVSDLHLTISATESDVANALANTVSGADLNDYCFVQVPTSDATPTEIARIERYKFNGTVWSREYTITNSGFTAAQWAALNSGITSGEVAKLEGLPTNTELTTLLAGKQATLTFDTTPTLNSTNPVTSGGVKDAIESESTRAKAAEKQNADDIDAEELARRNADTTLQGNIDAEELRAKAAEKQNADDIDAIEDVIPSSAAANNKLVDTATMNSSIATNTATFQGTYNLVTDLQLTVSATRSQIIAELATAISGADNNDYCFVQIPVADATPTEIARVERYKFNGSAWSYEYTINNSGFTAAQWAALNSGITLALVAKLSDLPSAAQLTTLLGGKQDTLTFDNQPTVNSNNPVKSGGIVDYITSALASYYTKAAMDTLLAGKQATLTFDATPTLNSTNPVQSNGIKVALDSINEKIPAAAAAGNQLADKAYVSAQVQEYAGTFRGTFNSLADLEAVTGMHHNDYAWVKVTDSDGDNDYDRYKYNGTAWVFEYRLNNTHFTSTELASIRSGITTELVTKLTNLPPAASSTISATTGADTITNGKKFFVGTQGQDGKWTLESLTPAEMQKCAYAYQANATVGTNPAHLQGTDANGDPERITPSALASLLGAFGILQSLNNVDISGEGRPTSTGLYALNQCTGIPSDISSNSFLRLTVIAYQSDRIIYLLQNPINGASYYRFWSGQWNASWSRNDSFGCNTTSELASALGVGGITDSCFFKTYTAPANGGNVKILNTPVFSPSTNNNTIFAIIAHHSGGNSWVDVLVSHSGNLKNSTICGTRNSNVGYINVATQINITNGASEVANYNLSILVFGGTIA